MNTKDNQRARLTRLLLKQAYLELMREKAGRITVKELCERAEVNRSTFYLHYNEPNDILIELEDETVGHIRDAMSTLGAIDKPSPDVSAQVSSFLNYVRRDGELYRLFLVDNNDAHFRRKLRDEALRIAEDSFRIEMEPERKRAVFLYIVSGALEVLTDWVRSDFALPDAAVAQVLYSMSEGGLRSMF